MYAWYQHSKKRHRKLLRVCPTYPRRLKMVVNTITGNLAVSILLIYRTTPEVYCAVIPLMVAYSFLIVAIVIGYANDTSNHNDEN